MMHDDVDEVGRHKSNEVAGHNTKHEGVDERGEKIRKPILVSHATKYKYIVMNMT